MELLKIANGYLPWVKLEYDRVQADLNSLKDEINSFEAEKRNSVRIYQDFCDRNLKLKNREDELLASINELEARESELEKATTELKQHISILKENKSANTKLEPEVKHESDALIHYHQNENEMHVRNILKEYWIVYNTENNNDNTNNRDLTWFHKIAALKLAKKCNEALFKLTAEGPSVMYVRLLEERLARIEAR